MQSETLALAVFLSVCIRFGFGVFDAAQSVFIENAVFINPSPELRKDALFIARQRQAEEDKTSAYLEARGKRSMAIMQDQEANWKSMKREKSGRGVKPKKEPGASI